MDFFLRKKRLFLDKNINRTFLHALLMGPEGIKMTFFLHEGLVPECKKVLFICLRAPIKNLSAKKSYLIFVVKMKFSYLTFFLPTQVEES